MIACDIRLDRRESGWLVTVTCAGCSDTFTETVPVSEDYYAAQAAARIGIREAMRHDPRGQTKITARGVGAIYVKLEAHELKIECEMRQNHPSRGKPRPA